MTGKCGNPNIRHDSTITLLTVQPKTCWEVMCISNTEYPTKKCLLGLLGWKRENMKMFYETMCYFLKRWKQINLRNAKGKGKGTGIQQDKQLQLLLPLHWHSIPPLSGDAGTVWSGVGGTVCKPSEVRHVFSPSFGPRPSCFSPLAVSHTHH